MVLLAVAAGYVMGSAGAWNFAPLWDALIGVSLVAAASGALNQFFERDVDARMKRTANRPLPSGRLSAIEVLSFGVVAGGAGCLYLAAAVNPLTAVLAAATLLIYCLAYTPLKRATSLCTAVGAVAGALPPVLGWSAASGRLDAGAYVLFAIMFLWQFPHFLAIAWLYREQYRGAGLRMLPTRTGEPARRVVGMMCVAYALALVPISLLPSRLAMAGQGYFLAAVVLGAGYLACAVRFMVDETNRTARGLLMTSLIYLPLLLLALTWDHYQLLR
jgi:protoheme IX farnesyltransferase